jgi:hypothetical protein
MNIVESLQLQLMLLEKINKVMELLVENQTVVGKFNEEIYDYDRHCPRNVTNRRM